MTLTEFNSHKPFLRKRWIALAIVLGLAGGIVPEGVRLYRIEQARKAYLAQRQADWHQFINRAENTLNQFGGVGAVYAVDLKLGWEYAHEADRPIAAASVIKVPIAAALADWLSIKGGTWNEEHILQEDDITSGSGVLKYELPGTAWTLEQLTDLMLTKSDNTASNILIRKLGLSYLNQYFRRRTWNRTRIERLMMDFSKRDAGVENYTTARDIGLSLKLLYDEGLLKTGEARRILGMLKTQSINDRIPALLPKDAVVAHKTGLERNVLHDAGIIYGPREDLLIVVLTHSKLQSAQVKPFIAQIGLLGYQYLNGTNPKAE